MSMGMNLKPTDEPDVMMDINTTPLIDVMLVLLIMLIITIPAQLHSVNMDMPASAAPQTKKPNVVRIEIDAHNVVNWNGKPLSDRAAVQAQLQTAHNQDPQPELHIKAHAKAKYEAVAAVLAAAQREGLTKIGVIGTEQFAAP